MKEHEPTTDVVVNECLYVGDSNHKTKIFVLVKAEKGQRGEVWREGFCNKESDFDKGLEVRIWA